jgi:hypothetical protein
LESLRKYWGGVMLQPSKLTLSILLFGLFTLSTVGLYQLSFNDGSKTAQWLPVAGTAGAYTTPGVIVGLWGADGDKLIVSRGEDPTGTTALHWISALDHEAHLTGTPFKTSARASAKNLPSTRFVDRH